MTLPAEALAKLLALLPVFSTEEIPLRDALNRVLASPANAQRDQPPFTTSMMDGYALNGVEADPEAMFSIIGEASAGHAFCGKVGAGECVRIFTGAPLPTGTNRVIKQEEATAKGTLLTLARDLSPRDFTRAPGSDFATGDSLTAPRRLTPEDLARLAAMNVANLTVARKPIIAILPTGDELVMPGGVPRADQIIASNGFALAGIVENAGGIARVLPIAGDTLASVQAALELAQDADLIVTTGGASVGDYDIIAGLGGTDAVSHAFTSVAMRPGRQMMAGKIGDVAFLGLPGNPTAVMVLGRVFLQPAIAQMLAVTPTAPQTARLAENLPANSGVETYQSARLEAGEITAQKGTKSGLLSPLSTVNALLIRPAGDSARPIGSNIAFIPL